MKTDDNPEVSTRACSRVHGRREVRPAGLDDRLLCDF
jgi:hypothetical protein